MDDSASPLPCAEATAETMAQVLRALSGLGFSCGLNPAQWAALRYIVRGGPGACSVIAFARYHGTTKGTASQTIAALEKKGLVIRQRDEGDRRGLSLRPTAAGEALLRHDPLRELAAAIRRLPDGEQKGLAAAVGEVLVHLRTRRTASPPSGESGP